MQKLSLLLIALLVIGTGFAFAQAEVPEPEVKWGVTGSLGYNVYKAQDQSDTDETGKAVTAARPVGPAATAFVIAPWFQMDWERLMVRFDGRYDHFNNASETLYSRAVLRSEYKKLFGIFTLYNDFTFRVAEVKGAARTQDEMKFDNHLLGIGAKVNDFNVRMNWKYNATRPFLGSNVADAEGRLVVNAGQHALDTAVARTVGMQQFYEFNDLTVAMDNGVVGAMAKFERLAGGGAGATVLDPGYYLTDMFFKTYGWFGIWDMTIGDVVNAKRLRLPALGAGNVYQGYTSQMRIGQFGASRFTLNNSDKDAFNATQVVDVYNVFKVIPEQLDVRLGTKFLLTANANNPPQTGNAPAAAATNNTSYYLDNYLAGDNVFLGGQYTIKDMGIFNAGVGLRLDSLNSAGQSRVVSSTAVAGGNFGRESNFWVDARLTGLGPLALQIGLDGQMAKYTDASATGTKPTYAPLSLYNLGTEVSFDAAPLKVTGGLYLAIPMGFDYKKYTNNTWSTTFENNATRHVAASWTEANYAMYGIVSNSAFDQRSRDVARLVTYAPISPLSLKVRADYAATGSVGVYFQNVYTALAGGIMPDAQNTSFAGATQRLKRVALPTSARDTYAFYDTNVITAGANFVPQTNQSLGVALTYTLFLGIPGVNDFYATATDANKAAYAQWLTHEFNPLGLTVTYSLRY